MQKIRLGVSSCLLGEKVRYDGQHKQDYYLTDVLGKFVEWVPVCPEVECGLPVPREAMHLSGEIDQPRLVTIKTGIDHTERMNLWAGKKLDELEKLNLGGFVFKSKSPSSGRFCVKVFNKQGIPEKKGIGLFARAFIEKFPLLPVEEEGRLHDPMLRECFLDKVFALARWREYNAAENSQARELIEFHSRYKYLLMAHCPAMVSELGRIVAALDKQNVELKKAEYLPLMMKTLDFRATVAKHRNVMHHILGYFKKQLTAWEKQEVLGVIENYSEGLTPGLTPLVLLRHYARKYEQLYLLEQCYLNPSSEETMLKYHL